MVARSLSQFGFALLFYVINRRGRKKRNTWLCVKRGGCWVSFLSLSFLSLIRKHSLHLNFVPFLLLHDRQAGEGRGAGAGIWWRWASRPCSFELICTGETKLPVIWLYSCSIWSLFTAQTQHDDNIWEVNLAIVLYWEQSYKGRVHMETIQRFGVIGGQLIYNYAPQI